MKGELACWQSEDQLLQSVIEMRSDSLANKLQGKPMSRHGCTILVAIILAAFCATGKAQDFGAFGGLGDGGLDGFPAVAGPKVTYSASFMLDTGGASGRITVSAEVAPGLHTYSLTQPDGGPTATTITIKNSGITLTGPFTPDTEFHLGEEEAWPDVPIEEYEGTVNWTAPFKTSSPLSEKDKIAVEVDGLVCGGGTCEPVADKLSAKFTGRLKSPGKSTKLRAENTHAEWNATIDRETIVPGDTATLELTVVPDKGYHVYNYIADDEETLFRTLIVATTKSGLRFGQPVTTSELESLSLGEEKIEYYAGPVTWKIPIQVPDNSQAGEYPIELSVGFATCDDASCDPPSGLNLSGKLTVGDKSTKKLIAMGLQEASFESVADLPTLTGWIDQPKPATGKKKLEKANTPLTALHLLAA